MLYLGYFGLNILKIFNLQYIYNYTCTVLALYLAETSTADRTLFVNHAFFIMGIQYGPTLKLLTSVSELGSIISGLQVTPSAAPTYLARDIRTSNTDRHWMAVSQVLYLL